MSLLLFHRHDFLTQNMAKMSLWQFNRLCFEPLTFEMVKNVPYLTPDPATKMTFCHDFVLIVLENWRVFWVWGLIYYLLRVIKRSQYYGWYRSSNIVHHFMCERLKSCLWNNKSDILYLFSSEMVIFWVSADQYLIL